MGSWIGTEEAMEQWWFVVDCSNLLILHMATIFITIIIINGSTRRSHNNGLWWMMELMAAACKSTMVILTKKGKPKTDIWIAAFSSHISLNLFALVYKVSQSSITKWHRNTQLNNYMNTMIINIFLKQTLSGNRLFILYHHDAFIAYLRKDQWPFHYKVLCHKDHLFLERWWHIGALGHWIKSATS